MFRSIAFAVVAALAFSFTGICQNRIVVFKKDGDVRVCAYGASQWRSVAEKESVGLHDRISIPKGGRVRLLDTGSNRVYLSPQDGEFSVDEVIAAAEKKSGEVMSNLNQKISDSRNGAAAIPKYSSFGATTRGLGEDGTCIDSLYSAVLSYFTAEDISGFASDKVTFTRKKDGDGMFHFVLGNKGERDLFVCIIRSDEKGISVTCGPYEGEGCVDVLPAGSTQDRALQTYVDDGRSEYCLLCSENPFSPEALNDIMVSFPAPGSSAPATGVVFAPAH